MNPNAVMGMGSKLNTKEIIGKFINIEKRRVAPVEKRKEQKLGELEAWNTVKMELEKLHEVSKTLSDNEIWEAKQVESSHPDIIVPTARRQAKPGKTTIAVDSVAMSHQITSQGFESTDSKIGTGTVKIKVGENEDDTPVTITITDGNNTLEGLKQSINDSGADVEAYIAKTHGDEPYKLLLTSKTTGEEGRIFIDVALEGGEVDPPSYENHFDTTASWKGLKAKEPETVSRGGIGSSTPITGIVGTFTGEEDTNFSFTVIRPGTIPSERGVVINWQDDKGRSGDIELNKFNYVPGTPVEVADGLSLVISDGEVVDGDSFKVKAYAEKSEMLWWLSDAERAPKVVQPSEWSSKADAGRLRVVGEYDGENDQTVVFRIEGSGQVGGQADLFLHYEFTDTGETGKVRISFPYLDGVVGADGFDSATAFDSKDGEELFNMEFNKSGRNTKRLPIGRGLFVEVPPGILNDGDTADVEVRAKRSADLWWFPEDERGISGRIDEQLAWTSYAEAEGLDEEEIEAGRATVADGLLKATGTQSTAEIKISGEYTKDEATTYTFRVKKRGSIGVTRVLELEWENDQGEKGVIDMGQGYIPGTPVDFDSGLKLSLGEGDIFEEDLFRFSTYTSTVRKAQDLVLRMGASDLGGGLEVRRSENTVKDLIPGVDLEFLASSETPVTISVFGDTERAAESIRDFVDAYNTFNGTASELSKYDQQANEAGPLLSDRNLSQMTHEIATTTISTVAGLPQSDNMLFAIGMRINDKGVMSLDESKLTSKITDDFAAVANLFRSNGISEGQGVTFVGLTQDTRVNPEGYKVDISKVATRGEFTSASVGLKNIRVNDTNNKLVIVNSGRRSEEIELRKDEYTPASLAKHIQSKIADDKVLGKRGIRVEFTKGNAFKFITGGYGKNATISVEPGEGKNLMLFGLDKGSKTDGADVEGTIDGVKAEGRGQLLIGPKDTDSEGLRVFVTLNEEQLTKDPESSVVVTKGIAVKLGEKLSRINNGADGDMKKITKDVSAQISNFDSQIKRLNKRISKKRDSLQVKFAKLDSTMGRLKSQQNYMTQQLSALGGANNKK